MKYQIATTVSENSDKIRQVLLKHASIDDVRSWLIASIKGKTGVPMPFEFACGMMEDLVKGKTVKMSFGISRLIISPEL
jgi:hypothetical protein